MNVEENRLQTFIEWPTDAVVNPVRIAKAGFFSLKENLKVECFSCGVQISEWEYGDQVMARHRRLSPQCPFVLDPTTSGNVPKITVPSTASSNLDTSESYKDEAVRLRTFENWPAADIITPENLARSGFYSLKSGDKTKCAFCNGIVGSWEIGDDPDKEHKRHFPQCPFVLSIINQRLESTDMPNEQNVIHTTNFALVERDNLQELGVQTYVAPKKPNFATLESRLGTFILWPEDLVQTPDMLSQAGFYYEGCGDQVRCFHCDGGLRHWDPEDDPWTEHARWFPRCAFVRLVKGQDFISACAIEENVPSNLEEVSRKPEGIPVRNEVLERELLGAPAVTALNIGLSFGRVKQAIREKLSTTGTGFRNADTLIEAALNIQQEEEEPNNEESDRRRVVPTINTFMENILNYVDEDTVERMTSQPVTPSTQSQINNKSLSLEEENRLLKEARLCKICMDSEVGIVFLPCGHLATCVTCAPNLQDCPVCRSCIKATVRTFLS